MPFHRPAFFLLLVVALAAYWLLAPRRQHAVLLAASVAFYVYAGLVDLALLLSTVALNVWFAAWIDRADGRARSWFCTLAIGANLSILGYFKYRGFVVENVSRWFPGMWEPPRARIPLGISFYVFQLISYQVELARRAIPREPRASRILLYILFFPHHQAGPIMRPADFLPQFQGDKRWDGELFSRGARLLLLGLGKKCLADLMAPIADKYFDLALDAPVAAWQAWRGAMAFGFQIYGDFSGYSDIAVGLGLLFGYQLDANFRRPYLSENPSEFWTRWHITLSRWLRDYLYIPLGGNRRGTLRTHVNLLTTMLLGGLWHGASWMFVLWGAIHGVVLVVHRAVPRLFSWKPLGVLLTFVATTAAWVPFRATSLAQAGRMLRGMAFWTESPLDTRARWVTQLVWMTAIFGAYCLEEWGNDHFAWLRARFQGMAPAARGAAIACAVVAIALSLSSQSTYVYFRF